MITFVTIRARVCFTFIEWKMTDGYVKDPTSFPPVTVCFEGFVCSSNCCRLCGDTFTLGLRSLPCCISVPTVNQKLLARVNSLTVLGRGMSSLSGSNALTWPPWWHRDPRQVVRNFKDNYTQAIPNQLMFNRAIENRSWISIHATFVNSVARENVRTPVINATRNIYHIRINKIYYLKWILFTAWKKCWLKIGVVWYYGDRVTYISFNEMYMFSSRYCR